MRAPAPRLLAIALASALPACQGVDPTPEPPEATDRDRARFVRSRLEDARHFRERERLESAEEAVRRALAVAPDHGPAQRLLARLLEAQGRMAEARAHWEAAERLDPPPPAPPDAPLPLDAAGLLVVLVGPPSAGEEAPRRPDPELEAAVVRGRLRARLPAAELVRADPASVAEARRLLAARGARAVLSLRTDRAFCGYSRKDGDFAVAWLRSAAAARGAGAPSSQTAREVLADPPPGEGCVPLVLSRTLEQVFRDPALAGALARSGPGEWSTPALRVLFPGLSAAIARELDQGRARLATGDVVGAIERFRAARAIDPDDLDARSYLREAEETLAIASAVAPGDGANASLLEFTLSPDERAIAEALLAEERRRRDELLAALVIVEVEERPPPPEAAAALRPVAIRDPRATGPRLARERSEGPLEARVLYGRDGSVVTTYYFAAGAERALLREDDTDGDGNPDRWVAYGDAERSDLWEDRRGRGRPDVHVRFAPDGGDIERIELDADADGRAERVFRYAGGRLVSEARDTDGDGVLDRFESFEADGQVALLEQDLDGNGEVDVRSRFREGRLVRREICDPRVVERFLSP